MLDELAFGIWSLTEGRAVALALDFKVYILSWWIFCYQILIFWLRRKLL